MTQLISPLASLTIDQSEKKFESSKKQNFCSQGGSQEKFWRGEVRKKKNYSKPKIGLRHQYSAMTHSVIREKKKKWNFVGNLQAQLLAAFKDSRWAVNLSLSHFPNYSKGVNR